MAQTIPNRKNAATPPSKPLHLGIFMPNWVGDACMATPTLRAIRAGFPNAKITLIAKPVIARLLDASWGADEPWFNETILHAKKKSGAAHSRWGLIHAVRQSKLSHAILLPNSLWSAATMKLAGVPQVVGYNRDGRRLLLNHAVQVPKEGGEKKPISAIDYYLELARAIGCESSQLIAPESRRTQLGLTDTDRRLAGTLWQELGLDSLRPTLVLNSNSATDPDRLWPVERVAETARRVVDEFGWQVLLHCGPGESQMASEVERVADRSQVFNMGRVAELPIGLSKAVMARADLVVSTDSGPRHIAVAMDRQVITLCGPIDPAWTRTYNCPEVIIHAEKKGGEAKMSDISCDQVLQAIRKLVRNTEAHQAA